MKELQNVRLDPEMTKECKFLGINISAAARAGIANAITQKKEALKEYMKEAEKNVG